jgi:hypothetical protein
MKNTYLICLMFICLISTTFAQKVTLNEAEKVARNFYYERINQYQFLSLNDIKIRNHYVIGEDNRPLYYVINIDPQGYIIVSGSKNVVPVPAYSLKSCYLETGQPPQFSAWMRQYADQISFALDQQIIPFQATISQWSRLLTDDPAGLLKLNGEKEVLPMLTSSWDQGFFYNQMCPADPAGPAGHCLTGCVATAMGQLCYYFRWPITGTGSYIYEHPVYGTITANFGVAEYEWTEMTNTLQKQNEAVAELLFHMGVSVDMDYGPYGSGMWNHKAAYSLRTYFKYSPETQYLYRDSTNLDWDSVIIAHLDRKIPMYYAGWSVPNINGHAFIVDGYQTEEYFHFNWGWSGSYDGYFYLDNLVPGGNNFNLAQELIINCYPDTINYTYPVFCNSTDTLLCLSGTIEDGSSPLVNYENNTDCSWLISPQSVEDSVSYIKLEFERLETEENHDMVSIYDGATIDSPLLGQFSGTTPPTLINSTGNQVLVVFHSDEAVTAAGWMISYSSITPVWCSGVLNLTSPLGNLSDGSGSFYYLNGSTCMWSIEPEGATETTIFFNDFDTEEDYDKVKILDKASNQLLATYSGHYEPGFPPDPVTSPSGQLFIIFSSNSSITKPGWSANYVSNGVKINETPNSDNALKLYPNPVNDFLFIELNLRDIQNVNMAIFDIHGRQIVNKDFLYHPDEKSKSIDISDLEPGIYTVRAITKGKIFLNKIVKINESYGGNTQ